MFIFKMHSSASRSSDSDSETEYETPNSFRGRLASQNGPSLAIRDDNLEASLRRRRSPHAVSSGESGSGSTLLAPRQHFTRSRSPAVNTQAKSFANRHISPAFARSRRATNEITFFPRLLEFRVTLLPSSWTWQFSADFRKCGESHILLGAILYASHTIYKLSDPDTNIGQHNLWIVKGEVRNSVK